MRQRFSVRHAVAFVIGRQHESIGIAIRCGQQFRRPFANQRDPVAELIRCDRAAQCCGGSGITLEAAYACEPPVEIAQTRQCLDEQEISLARRHCANCKQAQRSLRLMRAGNIGLGGTGRRNFDAMRRDAGGDNRFGGVSAGTNYSAQQWPEPRFERRVAFDFVRAQAGFKRERMMDEADETQALRFGLQAIGKSGQRQAVDHRRAACRQTGQRCGSGRAGSVIHVRITSRQFCDRHGSAQRAHPFHHLAIEEIASGELI